MGLLEDVATLLPVAETAVFYDSMPDSPDINTTIYMTGGFDNLRTLGSFKIQQPTFMIKVRDTSTANAQIRAINITNALDSTHNVTINGTTYLTIFMVANINSLGKD